MLSGPCSDIDNNGICDDVDNPPNSPDPNRFDGCNGCPEDHTCQDGLCIPVGGAGQGNGDCNDCDYPSTCISGECWTPQDSDGTDCPDECYFDGQLCYCGPLPDYDNDGEPDEFDQDDDNDGLNDDFDPHPNDEDFDNDGVPDGSDSDPSTSWDSDSDGTPDPVDANPNDPADGGGDLDGDGFPNNQDPDIDGDGIANENDDSPYGTGGSGGGNPGSGSGGIPGGGDGPGNGGGSGTGGGPDPGEAPPPPPWLEDPEEELIEVDPCEGNLINCTCRDIPNSPSYQYIGLVDYDYDGDGDLDCAKHYYADIDSMDWDKYCPHSEESCTDLQQNYPDEFLSSVIEESIRNQGKNLSETQLQNAINHLYNKLTQDQTALTNYLNEQQYIRATHLNQQQSARTEFLNNQQAARTDFLNDQQTTRTDWLNQQQHNRTAALDANQEARHRDLKQAIKGLGDSIENQSGTDELKDALIDPNATYSDPSTDNLNPHDFTTFLDSRKTQFSDRFDLFFDSVKSSALFTLPFGLFDSLPSGGQSSMTISIGSWGGDSDNTVGFDFADYALAFDVLRTLFLILTAYASFRIIVVKRA